MMAQSCPRISRIFLPSAFSWARSSTVPSFRLSRISPEVILPVRGKILSLREEDFATAAMLAGATRMRIMWRHLLPSFMSHIIVSVTLAVPGMILGETALSFLGLGLRPPITSWGVLLKEAINVQAVAAQPWLLTPVLFVIVTVLAFNFVGDGLRDAADPYAR